jgi:hypothetical protein
MSKERKGFLRSKKVKRSERPVQGVYTVHTVFEKKN